MRSALLLSLTALLAATPGTSAAQGQDGPTEIQPAPPQPQPYPPPQPQPYPPPQPQPYPQQPYPPQPQPYPPQPYPPQPYPPQPYPPQQPYYAPQPPRPAWRGPYGDVLGIGLRLGAIVPFGDGYAGAPGAGMLIDLSFWYEAKYFAIEPRFGVRFDLVRGPNSYVELPLDVGGYFVLGAGSAGGIAFFVGGGGGARHIWETRGEDIVIGSVLPATIEKRASDQGWGFGAFGRAGLILARSYRTRIIISVEYNVTVVELNGFRNPTSLTAGIGFVL